MGTLGEWIRDGRKALGVNQTELGALVGATQRQVSSWEQGLTVPSETQRAALGRALGYDQ